MDRTAFRSMILQKLTGGQTSSDAAPSEGGVSSVEVNRTGAVRMISDNKNPIELCAYIQHQRSQLYLVTLNGRFELKTLQDVKDNIQYQFVQYIFRGEEVSPDSPLCGQNVYVSVFDPRSDVDDCPTDNSTGYLCGTDENHVELRPEETVENLRILEDKDPRFFFRKPASEKCVCFESLKYEDHYLAAARLGGNDYRIKLKRIVRETRDSDPDIQFRDWYVKLRGCCETDSTGVGSSMRPVSELL